MLLGIPEILILIMIVGLIVLIVKKPKVGLSVLGGLALLFVVAFFGFSTKRVVHTGTGTAAVTTFSRISVIALPVLLGGLALIIGFIVLCFKKPKIALGIAAVLGIIALGFVVARPVQVRQIETQMATPRYAEVPAVEYVPIEIDEEPSAIWSAGVDDEYDADVYPSQKAAARVLGAKVVELATKLNGGKEPEWFEVSLVGVYYKNVSADLKKALIDFTKAIETAKGNPDNPVLTSAKGLKNDAAMIGLVRRNNAINSGGPDHGKILKGILEASVTIKGKTSAINLQFNEKEWLDNFSGYSNNQPGKEFVVARSKSSCTDTQWAENEVMEAASEIVYRKVCEAGKLNTFTLELNDPRKYGFVIDSFQQKLSGGVTDIYRKALLLDVSQEKIDGLLAAKQRQSQQNRIATVTHNTIMRKSWARLILSLAGLITVICAVYLFVNAATKGYYMPVLRIIGIVGSVICAIILLLALLNA